MTMDHYDAWIEARKQFSVPSHLSKQIMAQIYREKSHRENDGVAHWHALRRYMAGGALLMAGFFRILYAAIQLLSPGHVAPF